MAHIRRRDFALNLAYELASIPISFHPAAALVKRRIARTRELACDELVTDRLIGRFEYASALVTVAGQVNSIGRHSYTLGVFDADNLEERVMTLTHRKSHASVRSASAILASVAIILLTTGAIASAYSLNAGPIIASSAKQEQAEKRDGVNRLLTKDGLVFAFTVQIPVQWRAVIGTWKGSGVHQTDASRVAGRDPVKDPWIKLINSDVQIDFGFEEGRRTGDYLIHQKITWSNGQETFRMYRSELLNPQYDGGTITATTRNQQIENESQEAKSGSESKQFFKVKLIGEDQAETWIAVGLEESPRLTLRRDLPGEPNK